MRHALIGLLLLLAGCASYLSPAGGYPTLPPARDY